MDETVKISFNWKNIAIAFGFLVLFVLLFYGLLAVLPKNTEMQSQELKIEDLKVGEGDEVSDGDTLSVHYTGTLLDGSVFDSSQGRDPFEFKIGQGDVIEGWDKGIVGMKKGGIRKLTIPPSLAYGDQGYGNTIPPNSTLIFEVELLEIK